MRTFCTNDVAVSHVDDKVSNKVSVNYLPPASSLLVFSRLIMLRTTLFIYQVLKFKNLHLRTNYILQCLSVNQMKTKRSYKRPLDRRHASFSSAGEFLFAFLLLILYFTAKLMELTGIRPDFDSTT